MEQYFLVCSIVIVAIILGIILFKNRMKMIVRFIFQICTGIVSIYLINTVLEINNISSGVGINVTTAVVVGILGVPGVGMLYAVDFLL